MPIQHNNTDPFIPQSVIYRITKRKRYGAQRKMLDMMKWKYIQASDGEPLVSKSYLEDSERNQQDDQPNFEAL